MGFFNKLFGDKSNDTESFDPISMSKEAEQHLSNGLSQIEKQVNFIGGTLQVLGTGNSGPVMDGVHEIKKAYDLHLDNYQLHFAYASGLHLAMQYKSAEEEMRKLIEIHPNFFPAKLAISGWKNWLSPLVYPSWNQRTNNVHNTISMQVKTLITLPTRDLIIPRATMFFRDANGEFQDLQALRSARIDIVSLVSSVNNPQVFGIYLAIFDNPGNPLRLEELDCPIKPRGKMDRLKWEYFCLQKDIDLVIIDRADKILHNKRMKISGKMRNNNKQMLKLLEEFDGQDISISELQSAIIRHQATIDPNQVQY